MYKKNIKIIKRKKKKRKNILKILEILNIKILESGNVTFKLIIDNLLQLKAIE